MFRRRSVLGLCASFVSFARLAVVVTLGAALLLAACGSSSSPVATPSGSASPPATTVVSPSPSATPSPTASATAASTAADAATGRAFVVAISTGDVAGAAAMENDVMRAAAPAGSLGQVWQGLVAQYGSFGHLGDVTTASRPPYTVVTVPVVFANATVALTVAVDAGGRVAGLHVASVTATASATPAPYVDTSAFTETDVTVGSAPWALGGTLSMPNGPGPFPAVVLVAGSGPEDRDETIGPNKPLRDIAQGLASRGIAVLRYDKRTLVYASQLQAQLSTLTVKQETIDDAVAATALLRSTPKVDPSRVFLVGHSLGGYLAPRIATQAPGELRGLAMLEANSTPLPDLILQQVRYLASLQPASAEAQQQVAAIEAEVARAKSPDLSPSTPASELPFGVPAAYWLDLRTYDPLATAASLDLPMFFSQGGRDYQVPPSELQAWRNALAGHDNVTFHVYPSLDHLLFAGTGPSTPAEYTVPHHVAPQLIDDLASWIAAH